MESIGRAQVKFPNKRIMLEFPIHVIDNDLQIVPSLANMEKPGIYFNNLTNRMIHKSSKERI